MKSLISVGDARRTLLVTGVGMFIAFLLLAPFVGFAAGSVTIATDKNTYAGTATINVSGTVSPAPSSSGTFVAVSITGPTGGTVDANQFPVSTTGTYSGTFTTGGPSYATNGTYTISANYNGATSSALFQYGNNTAVTGGATTTTVVQDFTTTVVQAGATVVTTVVQQGATTTVVQQQAGATTTVVQQQQTTVTLTNSATSDSTALAVGAVGLIIAIVAIVLAVLTMRKK